jgi:hypothetical protein
MINDDVPSPVPAGMSLVLAISKLRDYSPANLIASRMKNAGVLGGSCLFHLRALQEESSHKLWTYRGVDILVYGTGYQKKPPRCLE